MPSSLFREFSHFVSFQGTELYRYPIRIDTVMTHNVTQFLFYGVEKLFFIYPDAYFLKYITVFPHDIFLQLWQPHDISLECGFKHR